MDNTAASILLFVLIQLVFALWRDRNYWRDKYNDHMDTDMRMFQLAERQRFEAQQVAHQELLRKIDQKRQQAENN